MRKFPVMTALAGLLAVAAMPGAAAAEEPLGGRLQDLLDETLRDWHGFMDDFVDGLPEFAPPIIDENGDIIIRRRPFHRAPAPDPFSRPADDPDFADT